ncbi:MAG: glycosyltransferase family 4 protein [Actinomycetota bacterium]
MPGVLSLLEEISKFPLEKRPSIAIASRNLVHPMIKASDFPNLRILGYVEDPRPLYRSAKLSLVPAFHVSGTKNQILQSWAVGTPVVSTKQSALSVQAEDKVNVLVGNDPLDLAAVTMMALGDDEMRLLIARMEVRSFKKNILGIKR